MRSVWNETEEKWYFAVQDVVYVLTDTVNVKDYIKKIKKRDLQLNSNLGTICPLVEMEAADGRRRKIQALETEIMYIYERFLDVVPCLKKLRKAHHFSIISLNKWGIYIS